MLGTCIATIAFDVQNDDDDEKNTGDKILDSISDNPFPLILCVYVFFVVFSVSGLCCYHTYLIVRGETTNENIKRTYNASNPNLYNRGFLANVTKVFCIGDERGYINFARPLHESCQFQTLPIQADTPETKTDAIVIEMAH
eukprot:TRINITY_DN9741_c0_g1_i2.p1 TRINITY_DN9741_c0_g1~~TRINITY_DN9741_c0_g1_i2.p1  ORF type:complete len:141 (-),score=22.24 TRINITY_DN9741_c0_g1_i2:332-754(-)